MPLDVPDAPVWEQDGLDWPNRAASRFVRASGLRWHVQQTGSGPVLLLVHGTGAATHTWRDLVPLLAPHFTVIAPDLPGHGFTEAGPTHTLSLPGMAQALGGLLDTLNAAPALAAGHSAGVAVLARMCLDRRIAPRGLVSFNGALLPLQGPPSQVFSPLAKLLARLPLIPRLFSFHAADRAVVARLIRDTGSTIDPTGLALYGRLMRRPGHAAAALKMMANWDLRPLERDLPHLQPALKLVVGSNDRAIPPADATRLHAMVPGSCVVTLPKLGHLAHEEQPAEAASIILRLARATGVLSEP